MNTAYADLIRRIEERGFHNHRLEDHSEAISRGILHDLCATCEPFADDFAEGRVKEWLDFPSPAGRSRKLDLVVAEPDRDHGRPDLTHLPLCTGTGPMPSWWRPCSWDSVSRCSTCLTR